MLTFAICLQPKIDLKLVPSILPSTWYTMIPPAARCKTFDHAYNGAVLKDIRSMPKWDICDTLSGGKINHIELLILLLVLSLIHI